MPTSQSIAIQLSLMNVNQVINGIDKITNAWVNQGKTITKNHVAMASMMTKLVDAQSRVATAAVMSSNKTVAALTLSQNNIAKLIAIVNNLTDTWAKNGLAMTKGRRETLEVIERMIAKLEELGVVALDTHQKQQSQNRKTTASWQETLTKVLAVLGVASAGTKDLTAVFTGFADSASNSINRVAGRFQWLKNAATIAGRAIGMALGGGIPGMIAGGAIGGLAGSVAGIFLDLPNKIFNIVSGIVKTILKGAASIVGAFLSIGKAITNVIFGPLSLFGLGVGSLFRTIGNGLKETIQGIWEAAAAFQRLTISLETLTRREIARGKGIDIITVSTEEASSATQALLRWMKEVSLTSPFTMASISDAVKFASAMGLGVKTTQDLVWATGNFAAAMGLTEDHQYRIMYNLAQIYQQGKLTGREFRDLAISFVPVYDILGEMAKEAGTTTEAFKKLALQGGVPVEDFFEHFINYMNTNFPDAMKKMARTWIGVQNNIKDFIQVVLGMEVFGPTLDKISAKLASVLDTLLTPMAHRIAMDWGVGLARAFDAVSEATNKLGESIKYLMSVFGFATPTLNDFAKAWVFIYLNIKYAINYIALVVRTVAGGIQKYIMPAIKQLGGAQKESGNWGANLITNFAIGMAKAAATVLARAIVYIRAIIMAFFKSSSPPLIAPKIDKWGGDMMDEWIGGMIKETNWRALKGVGDIVADTMQDIAPPRPITPEPPPPRPGVPPPPGSTAYAVGGAPSIVNAIAQPIRPNKIASAVTGAVSSAVSAVSNFVTEQGMRLAAAFMKGFSEADFTFLDDVQAPLKSALSALESLGKIGAGKSSEMFYNISQGLITAIAEFNKTGNISIGILGQISSLGMGLGPELADLVMKEFNLAIAVEEAAKAQERLNAAIKAVSDADKNVRRLVSEYNKLLRSGAKKDALKVKLKEVNAGEIALGNARKEKTAAEENKKLADERVESMKEMVSLQSKLVDNMIELLNAQVEAMSKASGGAEDLSEIWKTMGDDAATVIDEIMTQINWEEIEKQVDAILAPFWKNLGKAFVDTFNAELTNPDVQAAADSFAKTVKEKLTTAFGIFSGDTSIKDALGNWIGDNWLSASAIGGAYLLGGPGWAALAWAFVEGAKNAVKLFPGIGTFVSGIKNKDLGSIIGGLFLMNIEMETTSFADVIGYLQEGKGWSGVMNALSAGIVAAANGAVGFVKFMFGLMSGNGLLMASGIWDMLLATGAVEPKPDTIPTPRWDKGELEDFIPTDSIGMLSGTATTVPITAKPSVTFSPTITESISDTLSQQLKAAGINIATGIQLGVEGEKWDNTTTLMYNTMLGSLQNTLGFGSPATKLIPVGVSIVEGIMKGFSDKIKSIIGPGGEIATGINKIINSIKTYFGSGLLPQKNPLYQLGVSIVTSIANGIASGVSIIGGVLWKLILDAIAWAKAKLGWTSPAPQFVNMGISIAESIALGIMSGTDEVGGALSKTIYSAYKTIKTPSIAMRGSLTYPSRTVSAPSVSRVTNVNFGDININNGMDWSVFKAQVQRAIVEG